MKVLVIGSGGREHAIVWKLAQSKSVEELYCAPGNGGIKNIARDVDIQADDIDGLLEFAKNKEMDLTVVGPEVPLVSGIVDVFNNNGLKIFGPSRECARLEGSKIFAKTIMKKYNVPTADFQVFDNSPEALKYLKKAGAPIVVKADGLCAGKGVSVCGTIEEAREAIIASLDKKVFGDAGKKIVLEQCLVGQEASIIVLTDGINIVPLASSQDHKRINDDDKGPNTGGMGAYSPAPVAEGEIFNRTIREIIRPVIEGLKKEGFLYKGVLYAGIMITPNGPKALEFNVRFGDPETQAILPRLGSDLIDLMKRSIEGKLAKVQLDWDKRNCVCVVLASGGYPGNYAKGKVIKGLDEAQGMKDIMVFHSGTKLEVVNGKLEVVTSGGRVLGVTALGKDIDDAIDRVYKAVGKISFDGMHYRRDIARKAVMKIGV